MKEQLFQRAKISTTTSNASWFVDVELKTEYNLAPPLSVSGMPGFQILLYMSVPNNPGHSPLNSSMPTATPADQLGNPCCLPYRMQLCNSAARLTGCRISVRLACLHQASDAAVPYAAVDCVSISNRS